jgi:hypothetical protein
MMAAETGPGEITAPKPTANEKANKPKKEVSKSTGHDL